MRSTAAFGAVVLVTTLLAAARRPAPRRPLDGGGGLAARGAPRGDPARAPRWLGDGLAEVGLAVDPRTAWVIVRGAASVAMAASLVASGPAGAAAVAAAFGVAPLIARRMVAHRAAERRDAQLPEVLERLAADVRSGAAVGPAFISTSQAAPEPIGSELRPVATELLHGCGLPTALERWRARPTSGAHVHLAATALGLAAEAGGEVARSIDRVAATLRERRELQAEARALATQARASAVVLAVAPVAFTALVATVEPSVTAFLLTTPPGLICLTAGLGLQIAGAAWMRQIVRNGT